MGKRTNTGGQDAMKVAQEVLMSDQQAQSEEAWLSMVHVLKCPLDIL